MSAALIRPATPLDAGAVGAILSGFIDDTRWMPRVHTRAEDLAHADMMIARGWVTVAETVAETDTQVVGFLARDGVDIHALYLRPDAQGQGIGAALLEHAMQANLQLELWTFEANTGAQRFYERSGFTCVERTDGSTNDEGLPDRRYVWSAPAEQHQERRA